MVMACDFRIARHDARIGFVFSRLGLSGADAGVSYFLPRLVGLGKALELLMLGKTVDAREAERIGLVHQAVPEDDLDRTVGEVAATLAEGPPLALRLTKQALRDSLDRGLQEQLRFEVYAQGLCFRSEEHREGLLAFLQKRPPAFRGT